jgi:RNA polymerase sigma factor (sigma-70 family)
MFAEDWKLLSRYTRQADHRAFADLVRRYIALVYGAALRQTRDAQLADDVTQAVWIVLARKAHTIQRDAVLASWLFTVTRHAAQNAMKMQARQRYHERRAAAGKAEQFEPGEANQLELRCVLDEAIARLPELDRSGVLLHYFEQRSHEQVGEALGLSAEAARKRVARALEKMRPFLAGRGVVVAGSAALAVAIRAEAAPAAAIPANLAASCVNVAMLSTGGVASASAPTGSIQIAQGVSRMLMLAKLKLAASIALLVTCAAGATVLTAGRNNLFAAGPATAPQAHDARAPDPRFSIKVTDDIVIEFLGVSPHPGDEGSWFNIAGDPIDMPDPRLADNTVNTDAHPDMQLAIRVRRPDSAMIMFQIEDAATQSNSGGDRDPDGTRLVRCRFALKNPADALTMQIGIATSDWKTVASVNQFTEPTQADTLFGPVMVSPPEQDVRWQGARVDVRHGDVHGVMPRMIATDDQGKEHEQKLINYDTDRSERLSSFIFDVPAEKIRKITLQTRQFDRFVIAKQIAVESGHKTEPKLISTTSLGR